MVACFRQFLVLLLVLLQLVAPLVHAHTGGPDTQFGIHLQGLESLRLNDHNSVISSQQSAMTADNAMVEVDSGINRFKTRWSLLPLVLLPTPLAAFNPQASPIRLTFDTSTIHRSPPPWLQQQLSRAPPSSV